MAPHIEKLLFGHLQKTSRSFYLGITQLEGSLRTEVCLGYLVCRIFDCFEDATSVDAKERYRLLSDLSEIFSRIDTQDQKHTSSFDTWFDRLCLEDNWQPFKQESPNDFALLMDSKTVLEQIWNLDLKQKSIFKTTLGPMITGMLQEISSRQIDQNGSARSLEEFRQYCYWVAGTVGELLTDLFHQKNAFKQSFDSKELSDMGKIFGRSLQTVNIAKDFFKDWKEGRCFWPGIELPRSGSSLPSPRKLQAAFDTLVDEFNSTLPIVRNYLDAIDRSQKEIYFFCALPFEMALATMDLGKKNKDWIEDQKSFKLDRDQTFSILESIQKNLSF